MNPTSSTGFEPVIRDPLLHEAAIYLLLHSDYQVRVIAKAAKSDPMGLVAAVAAVQSRSDAPPRMIAMYGADRTDPEDVYYGTAALGFMLFDQAKKPWNKDEYRRMFKTLFGASDDEASRLAESVDTYNAEGFVNAAERLFKQTLDTVLWHFYDANTTKPDPDIAYEWITAARTIGSLMKRATYAARTYTGGTGELAKVQAITGASASGDVSFGDITAIGDILEAELEGLYADVVTDPLPDSEMGGWGTKLWKGARKATKAVSRLPVIGAALPVAGVIAGGMNAISSIKDAVASRRSAPEPVDNGVYSPTDVPSLANTSINSDIETIRATAKAALAGARRAESRANQAAAEVARAIASGPLGADASLPSADDATWTDTQDE